MNYGADSMLGPSENASRPPLEGGATDAQLPHREGNGATPTTFAKDPSEPVRTSAAVTHDEGAPVSSAQKIRNHVIAGLFYGSLVAIFTVCILLFHYRHSHHHPQEERHPVSRPLQTMRDSSSHQLLKLDFLIGEKLLQLPPGSIGIKSVTLEFPKLTFLSADPHNMQLVSSRLRGFDSELPSSVKLSTVDPHMGGASHRDGTSSDLGAVTQEVVSVEYEPAFNRTSLLLPSGHKLLIYPNHTDLVDNSTTLVALGYAERDAEVALDSTLNPDERNSLVHRASGTVAEQTHEVTRNSGGAFTGHGEGEAADKLDSAANISNSVIRDFIAWASSYGAEFNQSLIADASLLSDRFPQPPMRYRNRESASLEQQLLQPNSSSIQGNRNAGALISQSGMLPSLPQSRSSPKDDIPPDIALILAVERATMKQHGLSRNRSNGLLLSSANPNGRRNDNYSRSSSNSSSVRISGRNNAPSFQTLLHSVPHQPFNHEDSDVLILDKQAPTNSGPRAVFVPKSGGVSPTFVEPSVVFSTLVNSQRGITPLEWRRPDDPSVLSIHNSVNSNNAETSETFRQSDAASNILLPSPSGPGMVSIPLDYSVQSPLEIAPAKPAVSAQGLDDHLRFSVDRHLATNRRSMPSNKSLWRRLHEQSEKLPSAHQISTPYVDMLVGPGVAPSATLKGCDFCAGRLP